MTTAVKKASPVPSSEQKKLGVFLGRWHTTGDVVATASTPTVKVDSIDTYDWYPGGFFLVHRAESKIGDDVIDSLELMGYDPKQQGYFATFFDSTGGCGTEQLQYEGNTWIWRGSDVMGVKEHRCIAVVSSDGNTVKARHEKSEDGNTWDLW